METREFKYGARVRVSSPAPERAHLKDWEGRLGNPSRGPRVPGKRCGDQMGDWWEVQFIGGGRLLRRTELELI